MLYTNPQLADSDGDGLEDLIDPAPSSNPAQMGPVERGVARGLHFYLDGNDPVIQDGTGDREQFPFSTRYLIIEGAQQVNYAYGGFRCVWIDAATLPRTGEYNQIQFDSLYSAELSVGEIVDYDHPLPEAGMYTTILGLDISYGYFGAYVTVKEIAGEYYPVRSGMTFTT